VRFRVIFSLAQRFETRSVNFARWPLHKKKSCLVLRFGVHVVSNVSRHPGIRQGIREFPWRQYATVLGKSCVV
jgi:hypothetical protein